jgi:hypothetical protein
MHAIGLRIDNALAALRRYGTLEYSRRLLVHFRQIAYKHHRATVFRRDLSDPVPVLEPAIPLQFSPYTDNLNSDLHRFLDPHIRIDVTESRLAAGWRPLMAYFQGRVVALSWYSTRPVYIDGIESRLDYGKDAGYIEGTRTDEKFRGLGIAPAIRTRICNVLRLFGCSKAYVCAGDDNMSSQAVALKCGFLPYESIEITRVFLHRRIVRTRHLPDSSPDSGDLPDQRRQNLAAI